VTDQILQARDFVFRGLLALDSLRQLEDRGVYLRDSHRRFGRVLADISFAEFSAPIVDGAERMSRLYVAFFCFENSAREFISQRLRDAHGEGWWEARVPANIKSTVENRKKEEERNKWHQPRSRANINYTDFGHMPGIILNNWPEFQNLFDSPEWVKGRFKAEKARGMLTQCRKPQPQSRQSLTQ
jgi:hypothetical protein